jgi:Zn-finger nucleic acid-binding protein
MEEMTCPKCSSTMADRRLGDVTVHQCTSCSSVFLDRADLAALVEAENDWYRDRDTGPTTQPLPRITADMTSPPRAASVTQSYIRTLFDL